MDFELTEEPPARAFACERMMPFARAWGGHEIFTVETLRRAAVGRSWVGTCWEIEADMRFADAHA